MKVIRLTTQEKLEFGATHKVVIDYADVAALGASATGTIPMIPESGTIPAGTLVRCTGMRLVTAFDFSDAGITSLLAEVGDGGDTDRFLAQTELAVDGTEVLYAAGLAAGYAYLAADTVDVKFTAANGGSPTLAEATSGEVEFYLDVKDLNQFALVN